VESNLANALMSAKNLEFLGCKCYLDIHSNPLGERGAFEISKALMLHRNFTLIGIHVI